MNDKKVASIVEDLKSQGYGAEELLDHMLVYFSSDAMLDALDAFLTDNLDMSAAEFLGEEEEEDDEDEDDDENWHYENGFRWWATDGESGEDLPSLDEYERGHIYDQMQKGYSSGQLVTSRHEENEGGEANEEEGTDKEYIGWWESL